MRLNCFLFIFGLSRSLRVNKLARKVDQIRFEMDRIDTIRFEMQQMEQIRRWLKAHLKI